MRGYIADSLGEAGSAGSLSYGAPWRITTLHRKLPAHRMNASGFPDRVNCPECGRVMRAGTAATTGAGHWRHFAREHGINRKGPPR